MAIKIISMSVENFISIPDNPRQRDTVRHAKKAMKGHLRFPSETQSVVAIACINGMPVCKLDGHTRAYLWENGELEVVNQTLTVQAYEVSSMAEACELYTHFDSTAAVEGSVDKLSGACKQSGLTLTSGLLSDHAFNTALKVAHNLGASSSSVSEYTIVQLWKPGIAEVDSWGLPKTKFKGSGLVSLMFILAASPSVDASVAREFFTKFSNGEGTKSNGRKDGVQALEEHMMERRAKNLMTGYENILDMVNKGYSCFSAWSKNKMIINVQPSRDLVVELHAKAKHYLQSFQQTNKGV